MNEAASKFFFLGTDPLLLFFLHVILAGNLITSGATSNPQYFVVHAFLMSSMYAMNILEVSLSFALPDRARFPLRSDQGKIRGCASSLFHHILWCFMRRDT